ncbi:MAG: adenylate/guanylate cyclase domain-containing protein, partial [Bacteroidia bacterium]|nr:adenylate/guanylate cyclase domain-containing protein [Bacteroidia bacterium]
SKEKEIQEKELALSQAEVQSKNQQRNGFIIGSILLLLLAGTIFIGLQRTRKEKKISDKLRNESEALLLNILPSEVAEELKAKGSAEAQLINEVTVLFTDFKGFTQLSEKLSPKELVAEINECFSAFDHIMQKHGVEKIKTIGDAYMAAGGLPTANTTHANDVVLAALDIQQFMHEQKAKKEAAGKLFFEIRIGVHTGPVVAGIVGVKKFAYDIWGDTVNMAARMEQNSEAGKINISQATYDLLTDTERSRSADFEFEYRGKIQAKNKGEVDMYFVQ